MKELIPCACAQIQIVDTYLSAETSMNTDFAAGTAQFNRTLLNKITYKVCQGHENGAELRQRLPSHFQAKFFIAGKGSVLGNEGQLAGNGLPDNEAVKRVFMRRAGQTVEGSRLDNIGKL
jgi:hypothetical protein